MKRPSHFVVRGLVAGFLAATAVALWFLLIDLVEGHPFRTPAFLAGALLGLEAAAPAFGPIALYTILHYSVFLGLGVAVGWLLSRVETGAPFLLGVAIGFLLFDLAFYASVIITGVNVVEALGWPEVLAGNLIAGIVLMGYLHLTGDAAPVSWWTQLQEHRILREGLVAGTLGAVAVAVWFLIFDVLFRRPFFTPAALGSGLIYGADSPGQVQVALAPVVGYTLVHIVAFLLVGLIAAAIVTEAEEESPPLLLGFFLFFITFEALFIGVIAIFASWLLESLGWWSILIGNLVAAVVMLGYFWREHPALPGMLRHTLEEPGRT